MPGPGPLHFSHIHASVGCCRGLVVRELDSMLYGRGFDPHTGHGSFLKLMLFILP